MAPAQGRLTEQPATRGTGNLLGCGHVAAFAGICQYDQCGIRLCADCMAACEVCGKVLCRTHQVWLDQRQRVFCPADTHGYLAKRVVFRLLGRFNDA